MAYESTKIKDIVDRAVNHAWSIPEFQRGFVWKATQVRDLAESLWLDYPIGSLLVWNSNNPSEERVATDAQRPSLWVVDGQQRATALSILFGRKPYWWPSSEEWERTRKRYDIRFDIDAKEAPFFVVANAAIRKTRSIRYIPLCDLLVLDTEKEEDQKRLETLARDVKSNDLAVGMDAMEVYTRLDRVRKIRDKDVVTVTIDHELEDVVEIFSRLNSRGTRVTEADIYLGIVAARTPGWVRSSFLPYLEELDEAGFGISPNLLFRTLTGIGVHRVRFKEITDTFWDEENILPAWERTRQAWSHLILSLKSYGILSNDPLPTEAALVTMTALMDKFPTSQFEAALYWFLQASRFSRYSGSGTSSLDEDLRDINDADSMNAAVSQLLLRFPHDQELEPDDFLRDYLDARFLRFLLYLLIWNNEAQDWDERGHRLGFEGTTVLRNFRPQWHHVFPRKFLEGKVEQDKIDALANVAVIGEKINIRISAKNPMDYIDRYGITDSKLSQQFVSSDIRTVAISDFGDWLEQRAVELAIAGNDFLSQIRVKSNIGD